MSAVELARVFAEHFGYTVHGNHIQRPGDGRSVAVGWDQFAQKLTSRWWIAVGHGVNWRRAGETPTLPRVTRNEKGHWL
jgi:hypothetical protein